jgi:signal transduction histidine kinase
MVYGSGVQWIFMENDGIDETFPCPQCGEALSKEDRNCPNCGVDLFLLTLLSERAYLEGIPGAAPILSTPEILVPRIGDYLIDQSLINQEQLEAALLEQKELAAKGEQRLLGQTLVEMGFIDHETLDRTINTQIIELHAALKEANRTLESRVEERTAELQMAVERLTEINQLKANLISNVSHELRTPLAHIKGYLELVIDEELGPLTDPIKDALAVMQRSAARLESLIEDLIEFSTASREGLTLNLQPLSIVTLIKNVMDRSGGKAKNAGISLHLKMNGHIPAIRADPERLEWVLLQLVDNAIKFSPNGGGVTIGAYHDDSFVTLFVRDMGVGISEERIQEIFIPFHQLDGSATRRYGGTGLGLALVKLILDAHGSELKVDSFLNVGSTFSFSVPVTIDIE